MNYSFATALEKNGGDEGKAEADFRRVAELGGFGAVGDGENQIPLHYAGGLDLYGVLNKDNKAVSDEAKKEISKITGVTAAEVASFTTTSSANKIGVDGNTIDTSAADAAAASSESKKGK